MKGDKPYISIVVSCHDCNETKIHRVSVNNLSDVTFTTIEDAIDFVNAHGWMQFNEKWLCAFHAKKVADAFQSLT